MKDYDLTFSAAELDLLRSLIGKRWKLLGSREMAHDGSITWFEVFFEAEGCPVTLEIQMHEIDLTDRIDEISNLIARSGLLGESDAARGGQIYFHFKGEVVQEIRVLRETVTQVVDGVPAMRLTLDEGVSFELESGSITIVRPNDFADEISILRARNDEVPRLPEVGYFWESNLNEQFEITRSIIPIGEARNSSS